MGRPKGSKNKPKTATGKPMDRATGGSNTGQRYRIDYRIRDLETPYSVVVNGAKNEKIAEFQFLQEFPNASIVEVVEL